VDGERHALEFHCHFVLSSDAQRRRMEGSHQLVLHLDRVAKTTRRKRCGNNGCTDGCGRQCWQFARGIEDTVVQEIENGDGPVLLLHRLYGDGGFLGYVVRHTYDTGNFCR